MKLSRRASWFLIVFAVWSWFIWVTLVKNIWQDPRSWSHGATGFLLVHVVLAGVSLVLGSAIGRLGWRGLRATRGGTEGVRAAAGRSPEPSQVTGRR
ncbi:hypothetical protein KGA66_01725 [Actinocrinis puniceicyclus]|uniref:Uncharacterized protein n=1 Tax=Actinocrinis puniceicyclus TaxID=977794 RepID=A0A8J8BCG3_9ACTN|nr:hypothetical protein [Actinocrinis puniceicyclus]MBS2961749.1 hypothetical protein [Actinocrinis puniceicyclus]